MGDPLSISASIVAILQLIGTVVQYLNDVGGASEDRRRILGEVTSVSGILFLLKDHGERTQWGDSWSATIKSLNVPNGPIEQFRIAIQRLASKLEPAGGLKKVGKELAWPFQKGEVREILSTIEHQKTLFNLALQNDHIGLSQAIKANIASLCDEVGEMSKTVAQLRVSQITQESRDIIAWLSPLDFSLQQNDYIARRQEGTGEWFLESAEFKKWLNGTRETLFCPGIPGAGKTMLVSTAVDYLWNTIRHETIGIAYIYCDYRSRLDHTPVNLLASVLKQLLQEGHPISENLRKLYTHHINRATHPTVDELSKLLHSEMSRYSQVFILVDALDECSDSDGRRQLLLSKIHALQATNNMNLMATSRPVPKIMQEFQQAIRLEIRASDGDVQRYLEGQMPRMASCVMRNINLQEIIKSNIIDVVDGMFLLAQLHLDSLTDKTSPKAIKNALKRLPKGSDALDIAYDEALERINGQQSGFRELAGQVLSWVTYARRPLTVPELQHALAVEPGELELDEENLSDIEELVSACAGLVTVDQKSNIVRLVHYTTREYFERNCSKRFPGAQQRIAATCLTYLSFNTFLEGPCSFSEWSEDRLRRNPLLDYAAQNWGYHVCGEVEHTVKDLALGFLKNTPKVLSSAQLMLNPDYPSPLFDGVPEHVSGIHLSAYFGLKSLIVGLLKDGVAADSKDDGGRTPLSWAASRGQEEIVKLLLGRDDVVADSKDKCGRAPLWWAAKGGFTEIAELLLSRDDVVADSKDVDGRTPLSVALSDGNVEFARVLLSRDDVVADSQDSAGFTPLMWAAFMGRIEAVKLLLGRDDVAVNSKDICGQAPLLYAASSGHTEVVELLLSRDDVAVNSKGIRGQAPLSYAASNGHMEVVGLLLSRDDVAADSKDECSRTPLMRAALQGHVEVVGLLLSRDDVAVDSKDVNDRTTLSWMAEGGSLEIVKLLLGRDGVTVDSKDVGGRTPLSWAASNGHMEVVELLVNRDDVAADSKDKCSRTPLSWAAEGGFMGIVELLLSRDDVEADSKDVNGQTPLLFAILHGHVELVALLLGRDDVAADSRDRCGRTPLSWAAEGGFVRTVELLLSRDDVAADSKDVNGQTPLLFAILHGHMKLAGLLLGRDDVAADSRDSQGLTPLTWAASKGHMEMVKLLLGWDDVAADSRDRCGRTPLSWAAEGGFVGIVKLLLSRDDVAADSRDVNGQTPLMFAILHGHMELVGLLLGRDDVAADSQDSQGLTPLMWAASKGHMEMAKLLLSRDDVVADSPDMDGWTPLMWATVAGHEDIVKLLNSLTPGG
ncbi:hypothetical protein FGG08_005844 [Glutinoglossum americanum]|uniref:Uncharacterized protein n=1 Tax=Glutinoglossum americanum TaxID=1670608 RepID=A0A9P8L1H3_9PEZI|nr:hypothetical protein FGG08_005844 [Glutinoglossum americanum]